MTRAAEHIVRSAFPDVLERLISEARNQALEEAAKVADWQAIHISQGHGQITPCECAEIADRIAAAIRALKDEP